MSADVFELNSENFDKFISEGDVVIDFWAEWCGPCRMLKPVVEEVAKELKGKVKFGKVDVDSQQELAERFDVMSIPTLLFFKKGDNINRSSGYMPAESLKEMIEDSF